jgi:predicted nucleotidyltransferase component of viral defense system
MSREIGDFENLTKPQSDFLGRAEQDKQFTETFFLTGGTLLKALGIVPRESNDLDFFTFSEVNGRDFLAAQARIRDLLETAFGMNNIRPTDQGFLHRRSGMIIDVVADNSPNIGNFELFGQLKTANLKDIAAHKASALCGRDEIKDYIDIAFLTKAQNWLLQDLAQLAEQKFRLGTISEEKLLTELLAKRQAFVIPQEIFLKEPEKNLRAVHDQIEFLIKNTSL